MFESKPFAIRLAAVFLCSSVILVGAGWVYLSRQQAAARRVAQEELSAIADLKVRQISNWREERLSDARFFAHARFVAQDVKRFLEDPRSETNRSAVLHWLNLLKSGERYYAAVVFDMRFEPRLAIPGSAAEPAAAGRQALEKALQSHDVVMSDLHQEQTNGPIYIDIVFPVFEEADPQRGPCIAVVLLKLDARHFLFPLIQSWPTPSQTAETLLVRQEGNEMVYLNDLRHRPGAALNLRFPLSAPDLAGAKVLRGEKSAIEAMDYRGMRVVGAGRLIPQTSWAIVAKVDREEIYAPLRRRTLAVGLVLGSLLAANALLVGLLWHQRSAQFLERELALEKQHVAQHKAHVQEIDRLNRLYAALSHVNQSVLRAKSPQQLEGDVCRALVESGGFQMAWIGWLDETTMQVIPVAQCGDHAAYLERIKVFADDRPEGRGPSGIAVHEGRACVFNDCLAEPRFSPWREAALSAGWRSLAGFPIREEGRVRGALTVYSQQADFFGTKEQALIEEVAGDVSFGLNVLLNDQRRRAAEEQIRLQAAALESAANAIVITDRQGVIQWVNGAFERLTGYSATEAAGQTLRVQKSGLEPAGFFKRMWETMLAGQVWHGELVNKRKDGSLYSEEMMVTPVRDARGEMTHFIAIKQDISERKAAEEALRQSEERFRTMADAIPQLAWIAQPDGHVFWYNRRWYEYTGTTPQQMEGWGWQSAHDPQVLPKVLERWRGSISSGQPLEMEFPLRGRDGRFHPFLTQVMPLKDAEGRVVFWFGTSTDIADIVAARETLARSRNELERLVQERTAQLVDANASLKAFTYTAAHDLRSPLRGIASFSSIALEDYGPKLDKAARSMLEHIIQSAGQMSRLLDDLLEYSRMSAAELKLERVSLKKAISESLALIDSDIRGKNAAVTVTEPLPEVIGHQATVVLIINNLISNALKFVAPGAQPRIHVWAEEAPKEERGMRNGKGSQDRTQELAETEHAQHGTHANKDSALRTPHSAVGSVRLWVEDNGIGIAEEDLEKIFGAFQRLHGRQAYPGTGLGLTIVRKGAERMGGRVGVESEPGKGSRFWVELRAA